MTLLRFPRPQTRATFLKRPQRFLAHMAMDDGSTTVAYCANPGSLSGCLESGSETLLWDSGDDSRKRRYTWRAIRLKKVWVGTDTHLANPLAAELLARQLLPSLEGYAIEKKEALLEAGLRVDFVLRRKNQRCLLEVKSVVVAKGGVARYPDSVTPRSIKQFEALTAKARDRQRAVILFLVQRGDVDSFTINRSQHPTFAKAIDEALRAGVRILAMSLKVSPKGFAKPKRLKIL